VRFAGNKKMSTPAQRAEFTVNLDRWQKAVQSMNSLVVDSSAAVVKASARRFVSQAIKWTPPFYREGYVDSRTGKEAGMYKLDAEYAQIGEVPNDKSVGERAVVAGLYKLFVPMSRDWLEAVVREHGNPIPDLWVKWGSDRKNIKNATVVFTMNEAKEFHHERWKRGVPQDISPRRRELGGPNIRLIPWDVFFLFQQREIAQLGHMKAGWLAAWDEIGLRQAPAWIKRWKGQPAIGRVIDNRLGDKLAPTIAFSNSAKGIKRIEHYVGRALKDAAANLEADIARMVKYGVGKSGVFRMKGA
jgi:hypothetical protein